MKKQKGFSLIEVLIASVVFAVGMLAIAGAQLVSIKSNKASYEFVVASTLVEQQIEEMRANGAALQVSGGDSAKVDAFGRTKAYYDSNNIEVNPSDFIFQRTWTSSAFGTDGNQTSIEVQASWTDPKTGDTHSVFSNTVIHNNP